MRRPRRHPADRFYSDHMPELGSDSIEREKAFLFASRDGAYLTQVEDALQRIKAGTFGACRLCTKAIPRKRVWRPYPQPACAFPARKANIGRVFVLHNSSAGP